MSLRPSSGSPRNCSGDIYGVVPANTMDSAVSVAPAGGVSEIATPKSTTFTLPVVEIMMLPGLISRCTMPRRWASSSAAVIWQARLMLS